MREMSTSRYGGRTASNPQQEAAQAALDGAVAAFLDLDSRQSYVADAMSALQEVGGPDTAAGTSALARDWAVIADRCLQASGEYLDVSNRFRLIDELGRSTRVDLGAARSSFVQVHRRLADAATAVDAFYRKHSGELEQARSARAATPRLAQEAKQAALSAEQELTSAEADGVAYRSVQDAAGSLVTALSELNAAEGTGATGPLRRAAAAVRSAATLVIERIGRARSLGPAVRSSLSSVRTRADALTTRLGQLPATRSALLREFSAANTADLTGTDARAQRELELARGQIDAAARTLDGGDPEGASELLQQARSHLATAEAGQKALTDRLRVLRETRDDPVAAAKNTRFRLRDAQRLVVDRNLIKEWGSVLDAQSDRIDRAVADLSGPHPDYWGYLQALAAVESFVKGVIDRVRAEIR
jgi:hypothetical protein